MKSVIIYSGGLDSTVLLYHLRAEGRELHALSLNYGQRHRCELEAARQLAAGLAVPHQVIDLSALSPLLAGSSLTSPEIPVPEGHYAEENMKTTVVPNRNMIFLAVAAAWAISLKADTIAYAAHSGDHAIYPDCREPFAQAMDQAIQLADWHQVRLERPFVSRDKAWIAGRGAELGVPFAQTWSCYQGQALHCGRCGTCIERREAFHLAGIEDPTTYADDAPHTRDLIARGWKLA